MNLSVWWLAPLGVAATGAVVLASLARRLDRQIAELQRTLRPLRTLPVSRRR